MERCRGSGVIGATAMNTAIAVPNEITASTANRIRISVRSTMPAPMRCSTASKVAQRKAALGRKVRRDELEPITWVSVETGRKATGLDYGQVADAMGRHNRHQFAFRVTRPAGSDFAGHHGARRKLQSPYPISRNGTHDVTFRQDPGNSALRIGDHHRSNTFVGEDLGDGL